MVLLVVYLGLFFPLNAGASLVLFCGLLYDTLSSGPLGLWVVVYLCLFFSLKVLAKFLILGETLFFRVILSALGMIFQFLLLAFLPWALGRLNHLSWPLWSWVLPQVAITCASCWPMFHLFQKLNPPSEEVTLPPVS